VGRIGGRVNIFCHCEPAFSVGVAIYGLTGSLLRH